MKVQGLAALTSADDGTTIDPQEPADWRDWISATRARNWLRDDPLIDWLDRYGAEHDFLRDEQADGYDPRLDFLAFILRQGEAFERGVLALLAQRTVTRGIGTTGEDSRSLDAATQTVEAMGDGVPIITQGVLRDPEHRIYGLADLLIRSDVLADLFPGSIPAEEVNVGAPGLGLTGRHYRVIDIKFRGLALRADGSVGRSAETLPLQSQVWVYNTALGRIQGYEPPAGYLLGRNWKRNGLRGSGCLDRLGRIDMASTFDRYDGASLAELTLRAHAWLRELRTDGGTWEVLPVPDREELYPHMGNDHSDPWRTAKAHIASELFELTLLPGVSPARRRASHERGLLRWTDSGISAHGLGLEGVTARLCDAVLAANRADEPTVLPRWLDTDDDAWREPAPLELFVDFETVSSLADDFATLPAEGGLPLIFQIGCGWLDDGAWRFEQWTVERLTEPAEAAIIGAWVARMRELSAARGVSLGQARIYHWSPAERSTLSTAYNAARVRHPQNGWPMLPWFDLWERVVRHGPVSVTGAFGFGLKDIAKALHAQGLIGTAWGDGPTDGRGAMLAAWEVERAAARSGGKLLDDPLMQDVADYNRVDCQVMAEILVLLRERETATR